MMNKDNNQQCHFCTSGDKTIDYKDVTSLSLFTDTHSRIVKKRRSTLCSKHQRGLAQAVKRAREMALIPYLAA